MHLACPGLIPSLDRGETVVVPSTLLASIAAEQFSQHRLSEGREMWQRPAIYSAGAWLALRWRDARYRSADVPTLLSRSQEHALWLQIIEREHPGLFDASRMANLAARAANQLAEWHIPVEGGIWNEYPDARQFQHWYRAFQRECREQDWIARRDVWRLIPEWSAPGKTYFAGFRRETPALARIVQAFRDRATLDPTCAAATAAIAMARADKDFSSEIEFAARWSRTQYEKHPARSVAVFVPELAAQAPAIARSFEQVFRPASALEFQLPLQPLFHLNAGVALYDQPLVAGAMLLLELTHPLIHYADASAILRSPFVRGAAAERSDRALADVELRRRRELDFSLKDIEQCLGNCPEMLAALRRLRRVLKTKAEQNELPAWSQFIADWLEAAGWPGEDALTEQGEKTVELWKNALSELAALGLVLPATSFDSALTHLRRLLATRIETGDWSAPVQILDASAADYLRFDAAVLIGLSDEIWPPRQTISPLIPFPLQRATIQSAQQEREGLTQALFSVASEIAATYSGRLAPVAEPFVTRGFVETDIWTGRLARQSYLRASLDRLEDSQGPMLVPSETVKGGASLLKAQSLCPFKAFAEYRLNARAPEDACFGFDARERGGFLHKALENVWRRLESHSVLKAMPFEDLRALVQEAVADAVNNGDAGLLHKLVTRAEQERLEKIVWDWLGVERARKQPFTVETIEQEQHFETPGLRLRLRVDRIDRLENGNVLLIDYKSGQQSRNKLKCPRPPEPQLLVYAASTADPVDGVFFAEMKANDVRAVGFSREKHFESRSVDVKKHEWNTFLEDSRAEVKCLADQFVKGYAVVDPLAGICGYCPSKPLCRVNEKGGQEEESEC